MNDFESLISKISHVYKTAQNSIPENNTHDWYIYAKPTSPDECPCDFCKVGERKHLIVEVIPDLDIEKIEEVEFFEISKAICDNCLQHEVSLVEPNLWEITFWENWDDEGYQVLSVSNAVRKSLLTLTIKVMFIFGKWFIKTIVSINPARKTNSKKSYI
jgi:hypothetical protein